MKAFVGVLIIVAGAAAQAQHHDAPAPTSAASSASVMNYSAEERAAGLREGRGMGLALPAEANGYPGPRHVLEAAEQIGLAPEQHARTQQLFDTMQSEAQQLGVRLLAQEGELAAMFRERRATPALLETTARTIGETEAALKIVHLRTHLAMMEILTPEQVTRYVALRRAGVGSGRTRPSAEHANHGA